MTLAQLRALGFEDGAIKHRVRRKQLRRVHREVYALGHRHLTRNGHFWAAVLAGGPGAVLSHRSAAALWEIRGSARAAVDVTTTRQRRSTKGITFHRGRLHPDDISEIDGIPVTSLARTLLDVADVIPQRQVEKALNQAELLQLLDLASLDACLSRANGRKGVTALKQAIEDHTAGLTRTKSALEEMFLAFLRRHRFELPIFNEIRNGHEVDAHWPQHRLVVELDGRGFHSDRHAFEQDRLRDIDHQRAGDRTIRLTYRRLRRDAAGVVADLVAFGVRRR